MNEELVETLKSVLESAVDDTGYCRICCRVKEIHNYWCPVPAAKIALAKAWKEEVE